MNKFDKYYLKQGKLELSILDEHDDINQNLDIDNIKENHQRPRPRVKLTDDIYNTLQTMGKFLTKTPVEEKVQEEEVKTKEAIFKPQVEKRPPVDNVSDARKSIQARQLEEVVNAVYKNLVQDNHKTSMKKCVEEAASLEQTIETKEAVFTNKLSKDTVSEDEITSNKPFSAEIPIDNSEIVQDELFIGKELKDKSSESIVFYDELFKGKEFGDKLPENIVVQDELFIGKEFRDKSFESIALQNEMPQEKLAENALAKREGLSIFDEIDDERQLEQSSIDKILFDYFGETKPKHEEGRRLKQYIDQKIALIENYS